MGNEDSGILVVDDEPDILNLLEYNLKKAGYRVFLAKDGPLAIEAAGGKGPDLIILDIMLPDMDGLEVLRRLKASEATRDIPVIMLTAKGEEVDRVVGFELGAEDYITKPFSPRELLLRVRAVLKRASEAPARRRAKEEKEVVTHKGLTVDSPRHKVTLDGTVIRLSSTEFSLLKELINAKGRVFTRETLLDRVWGRDCHVTDRTVDTHVRRLREKMKGAGSLIETVRGVGYRFKDD